MNLWFLFLRIFSGPRGSGLVFAEALKLPIFKIESMKLIKKRSTMVISNEGIEKVSLVQYSLPIRMEMNKC